MRELQQNWLENLIEKETLHLINIAGNHPQDLFVKMFKDLYYTSKEIENSHPSPAFFHVSKVPSNKTE